MNCRGKKFSPVACDQCGALKKFHHRGRGEPREEEAFFLSPVVHSRGKVGIKPYRLKAGIKRNSRAYTKAGFIAPVIGRVKSDSLLFATIK
jgi:hypothetical protein